MTKSPENKKNKEESGKKTPAKKTKKKLNKKKIFASVVLLFALIMWWGLQPLKAGAKYGICRTYLETYLKYPTTFNITQYDVYGLSLRIFYTYIGAYGVQRAEMIECIGTPNVVPGYVLDDIKIDRKSIDPEKLLLFNNAIPGILKAEPNLVIPRPSTGDFNDLKRD